MIGEMILTDPSLESVILELINEIGDELEEAEGNQSDHPKYKLVSQLCFTDKIYDVRRNVDLINLTDGSASARQLQRPSNLEINRTINPPRRLNFRSESRK